MGLSRRGWLSIGCAFVAAGVPLGFGYVSGAEGAEQAAAAIEAAPERLASEAATRVALRVGERLAALVDRESRRPYFHYQPFYVDPEGAYAGDAVVPSPLADGSTDALVTAHFQIEPGGQVTLPSVAEGTARAARPRDLALIAALRGADVAHAPALPAVASLGPARPAVPIIQQKAGALNVQQAAADQQQEIDANWQQNPTQVLRYDAKVYQQNANAVDIYKGIKTKKSGAVLAKGPSDATPEAKLEAKLEGGPLENLEPAEVTVRVGPFMWSTLALAESKGVPPRALAAIRQVETPDGPRTQGFLLAEAGLGELLADGGLLAVFEPGAPRGAGEAQVGVAGTAWRVRVPFEATLAAARAEAEATRTSFVPRFALLAGLTGLAALAIVLLVIQSERLLARRQQFAAAAAHELRTPLAGLRMYAEMLAHGLGKPEKQRLYAERVADEAGRLGRVVSNVLDFTRLERGGLRVKPEPGDLAAFVREGVSHLEPAVRAAGASLALEVVSSGAGTGTGTVLARFDRDALTQVLANLVDNAEKYSREAADRRIELTVALGASGPEVRVRDHGPGFPKAFERRVFRPFQRGVPGDGPAGLGLGLALTRALVRAQGGDVRLGRPADGGAEVIISFAQ